MTNMRYAREHDGRTFEDYQAAWWHDFWGLPGSMMAWLLRITRQHDGMTFENYQAAWWHDFWGSPGSMMAWLLRITRQHDGMTFEDYQAAWWHDFWGSPGSMMAWLLRITREHDGKTFEDYQGAWWQDRPARRDRWGRGRCLRHPPPSLSVASPSWSPGQSYTCRCHWFGEVAFLPLCHSQENLKLLSQQTPSFKWACHDSCSRPPAKSLTTSPGMMKYLSWNIQKQGAFFSSCMLSLWN